jgi:hypothetical protein
MKSSKIPQAILAPLLFILIAGLVGLAALRVVPLFNKGKEAQSNDQPGVLYKLPEAWMNDTAKRGYIRGLAIFSKKLIAVGPGMGAYINPKENSWAPFHTGLELDMDSTAVSSNFHGLYLGTAKGRVYPFQKTRWTLVANSEDGSGIDWITACDPYPLFGAGESVYEISPEGAKKLASIPAKPLAYLRKASMAAFGNESVSIFLYLSKTGAAYLDFRKGNEKPSLSANPKNPNDVPVLRNFKEKTGLHDAGGPMLPKDLMAFPVFDVSYRSLDDPKYQWEILVALENIGVVGVFMKDGKVVETRRYSEGMPLVPVHCLTVQNNTIYAGAEGSGIFQRGPDSTRFEPMNAGLLHLP